jgi:hypothetical protein
LVSGSSIPFYSICSKMVHFYKLSCLIKAFPKP